MDIGLRTPLLDFFRKGDVARDVRMLAAQGAIAPRPLEQLGLLVLLTSDPDAEIRRTAEATLARIPEEALRGFLARAEVPADIRAFFAARGITPAPAAGAAAEDPFVDDDPTDYGAESTTDEERASIVQRLAGMSVPEKVKAAMKGTREMRAILIRDPNKLVALAVLSCPKVTDSEIESFARMGTVSEDVLRAIGQTRAWVKNYNVVSALVRNPKTPVALSLTLLGRLTDADVRRVSIDRNVPEVLRIAARRRVASV